MKKIYLFIFLFFLSNAYSQQSSEGFTYDNEARTYLLYVPTTYDASVDTLPLVVAMHGLGNTKEFFALYNGFHEMAEARKYIIATPQALDPGGVVDLGPFDVNLGLLFSNAWNSGAGSNVVSYLGIEYTVANPVYLSSERDDVGFLSALIDTVSKNFNVNEKRVYASGMSMGGFMSNRLACELSDKIAAIASVTGTMGNEIKNNCNPDAVIPVLHIHSTDDDVVAYENNQWGSDAEDMVEFWRLNNSCLTTPDTTDLSNVAADTYMSAKILYSDGEFDSEVEFYKLQGPDHGGSWFFNFNDFKTSDVIFDFFDRHNKKEEEVIISSIAETLEDITFEIYPNPATDYISLNLSQKYEISTISISNTLGKTIQEKHFDTSIEKASFDLREESQGVYFFQIEDNEGNLSVIRFYKK